MSEDVGLHEYKPTSQTDLNCVRCGGFPLFDGVKPDWWDDDKTLMENMRNPLARQRKEPEHRAQTG